MSDTARSDNTFETDDEELLPWSTVFRRSRTNPCVFNVRGGALYGVVEPRLTSSPMFCAASESTAFIDGLVIHTLHYGFGPHLGDGHHVIGYRAMRWLCVLLGLRPPRRLKGEPPLDPIDELWVCWEWQKRWPGWLLDERASIGLGVGDSWGLNRAVQELEALGGITSPLEEWWFLADPEMEEDRARYFGLDGGSTRRR